jgi:hypothetical protein
VIALADARTWVRDLEVDAAHAVVITDPVWPNVKPGTIPGWEDPAGLLRQVAEHFPRIARRIVVQLGCMSDPRILSAIPSALPFVRVIWLRYARPSYHGTLLNGGDVAYVYGSREGAYGKTVLAGEVTSTTNKRNAERTAHPCPRKPDHLDWIIANCTRPDDTVIDPFSGSGTTALACIKAGRRFLGCEIDPAFHAEASAALIRASEAA